MAGLIAKKVKPAETARAGVPAKNVEVRWYRVLEDKQVPRTGGHDLLRAGKELSSGSRDIELLRKQGVKMDEIEAPAWYVEAQAQSPAHHAELVEAGHDLGEHPEYKPAALKTVKSAEPASAS